MLCHKFGTFRIGQIHGAVCTNKDGHNDTEWTAQSAVRSRSAEQAIDSRVKREARWTVLCHTCQESGRFNV